MSSNYRLEITQLDDYWDNFVNESYNGSVFNKSSYLCSLDLECVPYFCYKNQELMAAVLAIVSPDGKNIIGHPHVIYDGIIYRDLSYLNRSQRYSEEFKIQEFVAESLINSFKSIFFKLHPYITDIRPFLWVNFHSSQEKKYSANIRYTSVVCLDDFRNIDNLNEIETYKNASNARRQEIRYSIKKSVITRISSNIDEFIYLYELNMRSQEIIVSSDNLKEMKNLLLRLQNQSLIQIFRSSNSENKLGSMAVFLLDTARKCVYYLFGASDPEMRNQHTGTAVIWTAMKELSKDFDYIDLEGINSPRRGWFKTSFGGINKNYFHIITDK